MTSLVASNAVLPNPIAKDRFIRCNKEGVPIDLQVPVSSQDLTGVTGGTIVPTGAGVIAVTGALATPLIINATNHLNLIGRTITVYVRGGVGQTVTINFPVAGYSTYTAGAAGTVTTLVLAVLATNQVTRITFTPTGAFIN